MSPDGSEVLAGGHLLLDRHLNQIADLSTSQATSSFAWSSSGSTFSNDGARIYVVSTLATTVTNSSGGSGSTTPAGSYTITLSAISGAVTRTTTLALTVAH